MAAKSDLIGMGVPTQHADLIGTDVATGLTATGTTLATSLQLTAKLNTVSTAAASTGVVLPNVSVGEIVIVQNNGANALSIWPIDASGTINGGTAGAAVTTAAAAGALCLRETATNWLVYVLAKEA